ncbi:MAG: cytochrome b/b6 domain-containing protein [Pseudomonadota bacterium]
MPETSQQAVRVWDLPTRLFHWTLALAFIGSIVSAKIGGNAMVWHFRLGYVMLALLTFRLVWGLVGGRWSRFTSFIYAPSTLVRYLRGRSRAEEHVDVGHNPVGSFSVFAMFAFLLLQVGTGLVSDDEISNIGPLNRFVSSDLASWATGWHKDFGQWVLIGLVVLHVLAIIYYLVRKSANLARAMVTGDKVLPATTPASADGARHRVWAAVILACCAALATWVAKLGG